MTKSDRRAGIVIVAVGSVIFMMALGLFALTNDAEAAYTNSCSSPPGDPDPGTIVDDAIETRHQRQEDAANCVALAERLASIDARLAALDDAALGTAAQRVALSTRDRERLDFLGFAAWGTVGLLLALLIGQKWYGAWRFLRD